jgi:hypothetical protein
MRLSKSPNKKTLDYLGKSFPGTNTLAYFRPVDQEKRKKVFQKTKNSNFAIFETLNEINFRKKWNFFVTQKGNLNRGRAFLEYTS